MRPLDEGWNKPWKFEKNLELKTNESGYLRKRYMEYIYERKRKYECDLQLLHDYYDYQLKIIFDL